MGTGTETIRLTRKPINFRPDSSRVILKPFIPHSEKRIKKILDRILMLPEETVEMWLEQVTDEFSHRHRYFSKALQENFNRVAYWLPQSRSLSAGQKLLIGAYFTHEYSVEAAALFNPSMVMHPDQSNLPPGSSRFILSFRATGEGHISSIEFRHGILDRENNITLDKISPFLSLPETKKQSYFTKSFVNLALNFALKNERWVDLLLSDLPDCIPTETLREKMTTFATEQTKNPGEARQIESLLQWFQDESFELAFAPETSISERIIFPGSPGEQNGIEDARFLKFFHENGDENYFASYTAFDGKTISLKLIETQDFLNFKITPFFGRAVQNKGLALFPEKIQGKYAAISRLDGESLFLMFSDLVHYWDEAKVLRVPRWPWEMVQIGNCGSPLKTDAGWLLLTHGVGPLRKYVIGAYLLDLQNPEKIIGALDKPILVQNDQEREGYVPNVVYSCGGMIHQNELILPYAYSDSGASIATIPLDPLLKAMQEP